MLKKIICYLYEFTNSKIICQGSTVYLTASGGNSYNWSNNKKTAIISVNPTVTTTYIVTVTDANKCNASDKAIIIVNLKPSSPSIFQKGDTLVSNIKSGILWYNSSGLITDAKDTFYIPIKTDNYYAIDTADGCSSDKSNTIHVLITEIFKLKKYGNIYIYPNPTSNKFTILFSNLEGNYTLEIFNTIGQTVYDKKISNTIEQVDLFGQSEGIYFVKIQSAGNTIVRKIIKQ